MASHNYLLFFSNYCKYSKDVLTQIQQNNLSKEFLLICIDSYSNIPQFVDRVPLIYQPHKKEIYIDESIDELINDMTKAQNKSLMSYNDGMDGEFCYIDENAQMICSSTGFMSLGDFESHRIQTPDDADISNKTKKSDSSILEKYMAQRDDDMRSIKDKMKQ